MCAHTKATPVPRAAPLTLPGAPGTPRYPPPAALWGSVRAGGGPPSTQRRANMELATSLRLQPLPCAPRGGGPQLPRLRGDISASLSDAPQAAARRPERVRSQEPGRRAKHRRARSEKASWKESICLQARCPFFRLVCELWHSKARGPRAQRPEKRGEPERVAD